MTNSAQSKRPTRGSRRRFLGTMGLAVAAPGVITRLGAAAVSPSDVVQVGLVGCGTRGCLDLATFLGQPEVVCSVICDVDEWKLSEGARVAAAAGKRKPSVVHDFRRVIDRRDVDAVIVATPDHWHALPMIFAAQAGKDVYLETPVAKSIDEGRAMLMAMQKYKRIVQSGATWRSGGHWQDAIRFVRSGKLGRIGLVEATVWQDPAGGIGHFPDAAPPETVDYEMWLGPAPERPFNPNRFHHNWRWFWDYAGGLLTSQGALLLDLVIGAMGAEPPSTVSASGGKQVWDDDSETPDTEVVIYQFPAYTLVYEHKTAVARGMGGRAMEVVFAGSTGTLVLSEAGWEIIPAGTQARFDPARFEATGGSRTQHVRNFLDCMKSREVPVDSLEIAHNSSTLAHLGNIALRSGRRLQWDPLRETVLDDVEADRFIATPYRRPWKLPYSRRA